MPRCICGHDHPTLPREKRCLLVTLEVDYAEIERRIDTFLRQGVPVSFKDQYLRDVYSNPDTPPHVIRTARSANKSQTIPIDIQAMGRTHRLPPEMYDPSVFAQHKPATTRRVVFQEGAVSEREEKIVEELSRALRKELDQILGHTVDVEKAKRLLNEAAAKFLPPGKQLDIRQLHDTLIVNIPPDCIDLTFVVDRDGDIVLEIPPDPMIDLSEIYPRVENETASLEFEVTAETCILRLPRPIRERHYVDIDTDGWAASIPNNPEQRAKGHVSGDGKTVTLPKSESLKPGKKYTVKWRF